MQALFVAFFMMLPLFAFAQEASLGETQKDWLVERMNFSFENDIVFHTDSQYSAGWKVSSVYYMPEEEPQWLQIPLIADSKKSHFISFAIAQQIYTPENLNSNEVILDDRPYAGWLYGAIGLHQSTSSELDSFTVEIGFVGEASGAEFVQVSAHELLNNSVPKGWANQLKNELGINLIYQHKWYFAPEPFLGVESNIVPLFEATLGNVKTKLTAGVQMRFGWNPLKDFAPAPIDIGGENGIPIHAQRSCDLKNSWGFTLNLAAGGQAVAHDIFLDGNSLDSSRHVEKENFTSAAYYGFTLRYKHVVLNYVLAQYSKQFKAEVREHSYGSVLISYIY